MFLTEGQLPETINTENKATEIRDDQFSGQIKVGEFNGTHTECPTRKGWEFE